MIIFCSFWESYKIWNHRHLGFSKVGVILINNLLNFYTFVSAPVFDKLYNVNITTLEEKWPWTQEKRRKICLSLYWALFTHLSFVICCCLRYSLLSTDKSWNILDLWKKGSLKRKMYQMLNTSRGLAGQKVTFLKVVFKGWEIGYPNTFFRQDVTNVTFFRASLIHRVSIDLHVYFISNSIPISIYFSISLSISIWIGLTGCPKKISV